MLDHDVFANSFHRVVLLGALALDEVDFTERPTTDQAYKLEIVPVAYSEAIPGIEH